MKRISAKIGVLALVLVLCMATLSVGLAMWSQTLEIDGTVSTGDIEVLFSNSLSNDPEMVDPAESLDPNEMGSWSYTDINNTATWSWSGTTYTKDMGSTTATVQEDLATGNLNGLLYLSLGGGYPRYCSNVAFTISNLGTVPVALEAIMLTHVSKDTVIDIDDIDMVAGGTKYVRFVDGPGGLEAVVSDVEEFDGLGNSISEFSLTLCDINPMDEIDPNGGALFGSLYFRVEDGASTAVYDFTLEIVAAQYNEAGL